MPGRPCQICADAASVKLAAEMIATGASDRAVASMIGGISRMAVARHRQNHIERPAKAIVAAANKGKDVRDERDQLVAAAEAGNVAAAFLGLGELIEDLRRVRDRLERAAGGAEADDQRLAVASLSGQQLRATEVRAKLGGVGGYATPRGAASDAPKFELNIIFSGGQTTRIEGTPMHPDALAGHALPTVPLSINGTHGASGNGARALADGSDDDEETFDEDV
jgi:hypothetical protein